MARIKDTHVFYAARSADKTAAAIAAFLRPLLILWTSCAHQKNGLFNLCYLSVSLANPDIEGIKNSSR